LKLPNGDRAIVDQPRVTLPESASRTVTKRPPERHNASVLGYTAEDAEELRNALLEAAGLLDAVPGEQDEYGERYTLDLIVVSPIGQATVRSGWIVRKDEDFPRLTTCYVL